MPIACPVAPPKADGIGANCQLPIVFSHFMEVDMKKVLLSTLFLGLVFGGVILGGDVFAQEEWDEEGWEISTYQFPVYTDISSLDNHFIPSGWMGDYGDITLDKNWQDNPHSGETCIKISYSAEATQGNRWAGIYWQEPANNWGEVDGGFDLTGATKLTFWARGEKGGEKAEFKVGGIRGKYSDSLQPAVSSGVIVLTNEWTPYSINLEGRDLSYISGGFCWVTSLRNNPEGCTIYLDDIKFE